MATYAQKRPAHRVAARSNKNSEFRTETVRCNLVASTALFFFVFRRVCEQQFQMLGSNRTKRRFLSAADFDYKHTAQLMINNLEKRISEK